MRIGLIAILFFLPHAAGAWTGAMHGQIAKESLSDVAQAWGLDQPLERTSFEKFLRKFQKTHPEVQTREDFCLWLKINPESRFDQPSRAERAKKTLTPIEIVTHYAPRADDGRDLNLPYDQAEQFWFGSGSIIGARVAPSTGKARGATPSRSRRSLGRLTGSQAFRHMEKPAFDPFHPLNTFGFPLGSIGQASQRAQIYFDLAVEVFKLGEPYWAWNFLGVALHYIQDLGQPYHTAQLLAPLAFRGLQAHWQWGRKEKRGWIETITRVVSNAHHYFEGYTDYFFWKETAQGKHWKRLLHGRQTQPGIASIENLAKQVRNRANGFAFATVEATFQITGKSLLTPRLYDVWDETSEHPEDPLPYLTADQAQRIKGAGQISKIMVATLRQQGELMRTMVEAFLRAARQEG